ncbi:44369_t:CDS:2, partial [Gigaspora margarita]
KFKNIRSNNKPDFSSDELISGVEIATNSTREEFKSKVLKNKNQSIKILFADVFDIEESNETFGNLITCKDDPCVDKEKGKYVDTLEKLKISENECLAIEDSRSFGYELYENNRVTISSSENECLAIEDS